MNNGYIWNNKSYEVRRSNEQTAKTPKKNKFKTHVYWVYLIPWLAGLLFLKAYPMLSSLYYSFTDMHLFKGTSEHGLMNYEKIFNDPMIVESMLTTVKYVLITVPLKLTAALIIAMILNYRVKGVGFFRTIYYIPSILGGSVAVAVLWRALFRDEGLVNAALSGIGFDGINFLSDTNWSLIIICLLRVWQFGSSMVIFLAALKNVPDELYEASMVDGAGKTHRFFNITLPLITPVIFFNFITQLCQAFQEFNGPFIITNGGPLRSTTLFSLLIYRNAFTSYEMGMASAMSWVLFIGLVILTSIAFISEKYWVFYDDSKEG